ncbi:hypothetical protein [Streptomyces sp. NPDC059247]
MSHDTVRHRDIGWGAVPDPGWGITARLRRGCDTGWGVTGR